MGIGFRTTINSPTLEKKGGLDSGHGFYNDALTVYMIQRLPALRTSWENTTLRIGTDKLMTAPAPVLIVSYVMPVSSASAEIWDIDGHNSGTEMWVITGPQ